MDCHFAWSAELWEADDASSFSEIAVARSGETTLPPLSEVVEYLLETPKTAGLAAWSSSLSPEHLLILIYGKWSSILERRNPLLNHLS